MVGLLVTLINGAITVAPAVEAVIRQRRTRVTADVLRDVALERAALQRAWEAFQLQSRQRTTIFAAFIVGITILGLTYALALIGELPWLGAAVALAGMALVGFFNRFDAVQRARLQAVELAMREIDERLVAEGDPSNAFLAQTAPGGFYHEALTLLFQMVAFWGFFAAAVYAVVEGL